MAVAVRGIGRALHPKWQWAVVRSARPSAMDMRVFTCWVNSIRQWPWNRSWSGRVTGVGPGVLIHLGQEIRVIKAHRNAFVDEGRYGRDHLDKFQPRCWDRPAIGTEIACTRRDDVLCYQNYGGSTRGKPCGAARRLQVFTRPIPLQWILDLNLFGHKCV